jgi:hypothetical protein
MQLRQRACRLRQKWQAASNALRSAKSIEDFFHLFTTSCCGDRVRNFILNLTIYPVATTPITIGKYRIAACASPSSTGRFSAQVSIASGRGSASTDRVMRFVDEFSTQDAAAQYALAQGVDWAHTALRMH